MPSPQTAIKPFVRPDKDGQTHYVPWFTHIDASGRTQQAACTAYVDPACHTTEPSCWGCKAWLEDDRTALQLLRDAERNQ